MRARLAALRVCLLAAALHASCAADFANWRPPPLPPTDNSLGPGDLFAVRVFNEQDLSQDYRIAPDGTIDFPYVGRVRVQGMEPPALADHLRDLLRDRQILVNPQVSVRVQEFNSRRISVLGAVQHPGTFPFEVNMTIVQAITAAGGFTSLANKHSVRLTRAVRGQPSRTYEIPVDWITDGRVSNVLLAPGDLISVPEVVV